MILEKGGGMARQEEEKERKGALRNKESSSRFHSLIAAVAMCVVIHVLRYATQCECLSHYP